MQEIAVTDEMPKEFEIGLLLQGENGEDFYFSAPIKQVDDVEKILVQHSETVDGLEINVDEFTISDTGTSISYKGIEDAQDSGQGRHRAAYIEFKMVDQEGNVIENHSGGVQGKRESDQMIFTSNKQFDSIDANVTEVTVTPYMDFPTGGGGVTIDKDGNEEELDMDELQEIEFESFTIQIP